MPCITYPISGRRSHSTGFARCSERMACCGLWDVVYEFAPADAEARIEAWCATGGDTVEAEWGRAELEEHVRNEHSTFTCLLEPMIARSGFKIAHAEHSEDGIFAKYLLRARDRQARREARAGRCPFRI